MLASFESCRDSLSSGNLAVLPTETVYGLSAIATNISAIEKVYSLKQRPKNNPLIVHVQGLSDAQQIADFSSTAQKIAKVFWPGPITLIVPKKETLPSIVTAGLSSVALRSPLHPFFRRMMESLNMPIAAPSANKSTKVSPTTAQQVIEEFGKDCPPTLEGGPCEIGIESTVLDLTQEKLKILRLGPINHQQIEHACDLIVDYEEIHRSNEEFPSKSPGNMRKHYAPETPLFLHKSISKLVDSNAISTDDLLLLPSPDSINSELNPRISVSYFSQSGSSIDVARGLYSTLKEADKSNARRIHISLLTSNDGMSRAINDRLIRASSKII